ncbi:hypothetical protein AN958_10841 [Leucoagaricus sp. SymC.cos]|nr:hypothetical protein AN958_10841 [Leucoagaricus sp. SymC.cos]
MVTHYVNLQTWIDSQQCNIRFLVTQLAKKTLILGIPFLKHFNPDIDWSQCMFKWRRGVSTSFGTPSTSMETLEPSPGCEEETISAVIAAFALHLSSLLAFALRNRSEKKSFSISIPTIIEMPSIDSSEERLHLLDHARNKAIASHKLSVERMAKRITSTFKLFKSHQKVWLEATNLCLSYPSSKIAPKVISPWVYKLNLPPNWKIHLVFHASLLTPCNKNDIHGPNLSLPPPEMIQGEEQYEVEGIVNHHYQAEGLQYLVKWKGYGHQENEWIHEEELT